MFSWYLIVLLLLRIGSIQSENLFNTGTGNGFLVDPFLELTAGVTSPPDGKSSKSDSTACLSHGSVASAVICTILLCTFAAFLIWLVYLRQKLQGQSAMSFLCPKIVFSSAISPTVELRFYQSHEKKYAESFSEEYLHTTPASPPSNNYQKSSRKERTYNGTAQRWHLHSLGSLSLSLPVGRYDHQGNPLPLDVTDYKVCTSRSRMATRLSDISVRDISFPSITNAEWTRALQSHWLVEPHSVLVSFGQCWSSTDVYLALFVPRSSSLSSI